VAYYPNSTRTFPRVGLISKSSVNLNSVYLHRIILLMYTYIQTVKMWRGLNPHNKEKNTFFRT